MRKPYKGWNIKTEFEMGQKRFRGMKEGHTDFLAMSIKRLKLKIDALLIMPQILDKQSNFV